MKSIKMKLAFVVAVFGVVFSVAVLFGIYNVTKITCADSEPSVGIVDELRNHDSGVTLECGNGLSEGVLPEDIYFSWTFEQNYYGRDSGVPRTQLENSSEISVTEDGTYIMRLKVKNNSDTTLSGWKLFCTLPIAHGDSWVVADELTYTTWLEHETDGKSLAQARLHFMSENTPIEAGFMNGSAGYLQKGSAEAQLLEAYDNNATMRLSDFWRNEGLELDIPAGEEWTITLDFVVKPVYNLFAKTAMSPLEGDNWGQKFIIQTLFNEKQQFHIVSDLTNRDETAHQVKYWPIFYGDAELVPGSVKLDGESVADFIPQEESSSKTNFETVSLGEVAPGETTRLEYDVKISTNQQEALLSGHFFSGGTSVRSALYCKIASFSRWKDAIARVLVVILLICSLLIIVLLLRIGGLQKNDSTK